MRTYEYNRGRETLACVDIYCCRAYAYEEQTECNQDCRNETWRALWRVLPGISIQCKLRTHCCELMGVLVSRNSLEFTEYAPEAHLFNFGYACQV